MEFKTTKGMAPDKAPNGIVLAKHLKPFFGGWAIEYTTAYFDNPSNYVKPKGNEGWKDWNSSRQINVIAYCELPEINQEENPWFSIDQEEIEAKHGTFFPNYGCVGE